MESIAQRAAVMRDLSKKISEDVTRACVTPCSLARETMSVMGVMAVMKPVAAIGVGAMALAWRTLLDNRVVLRPSDEDRLVAALIVAGYKFEHDGVDLNMATTMRQFRAVTGTDLVVPREFL